MNYEIHGTGSLPTIFFDDEMMVVNDKEYPYKEIKSIEITNSQLFSTYGIIDVIFENGHKKTIAFNRHKQEAMKQAIRQFKKIKSKTAETSSKKEIHSMNTTSIPVEELTQLKQLLDQGIITQEDFDAKKKQLLGL